MAGKTQHINRGWLEPVSTAALILFSAIALYEFRIHTAMYGLDRRLSVIVDTLQYPEHPDILIRTRYTGIAGLDYGLRFLVTVFLPSVAPFSEYQQVQLGNFLLGFFPLVVIFSVEATRRGSNGSWIRYPSIWALLYQTVGGAVIVPIWFLLFLRSSAQTKQYESSSARLPPGYVRALLPAHVLGYLIPTIVLFLPFHDPDLSLIQALIANWQPCPLYVSVLLVTLARILGSNSQITVSSDNDLRYIKSTYAFSFIVAAVTHIALLYRWTQGQWSLADVFVPRQGSLQGSVAELIYYIFQLDFLFIFASAVLAAYVVTIDLRILGRSKVSSLTAVGSMVLGTVLVGPGATVAAVWWWREDKLRLGGFDKGRKGG